MSNYLINDDLKQLCTQPIEGKAYYRPFLCKGDFSKARIFLVGINPATPIFPQDMDLNDYTNLLLNYNGFLEYYHELRKSKNKRVTSKTRQGINCFLDWLAEHTTSSIIETNSCVYPTESEKLLKQEPCSILERGKEIFFELFIRIQPDLLIVHGKSAQENLIDIFAKKKIHVTSTQSQTNSIHYPNGKTCIIITCKHFMYYGKGNGKVGNSLKKDVLANLPR